VPRLQVKGAFGVGFADRSLALATLDLEPLRSTWHAIAGRLAPALIRARHGEGWLM
jgi:hypothetical protein